MKLSRPQLVKIVLLCLLIGYIILFQIPSLRNLKSDIEVQKEIYEAMNRKWRRDSTRSAHEIQMLDSALYRIRNSQLKKVYATCPKCGTEIHASFPEPSEAIQIRCRCGAQYTYDPATPGQ